MNESQDASRQSPPLDRPKILGPTGMFSNLRVVSLGTLVSRMLGLFRDMAMAALFGAGTTLDTFVVAFRIPNLSRQLFGEGALTTAFLPVFLRTQHEHGDQTARATLTATAMVLTVVLATGTLVGEIGLWLAWQRFELSESAALLVILLMIMLPYMVLICVAALLCAALHSLRQFFWPAIVPIVLNLIWMSAIGIAAVSSKSQTMQAIIVAWSVTFAGIIQTLIPCFVLHASGMGLTTAWKTGLRHVGEVFRTMLPILAGMTVIQLASILDSLLAWFLARPDHGGVAVSESFGIAPILESGTASALYIGQRMYQFPLGVFGTALGTVLYPLLTQHAQRGEIDKLRADLARGIRIVIAIAAPASAGLFLLAGPITNVLFQRGEFDADDAALAAKMVAVYGAGVWSYVSLGILNRAFFAIGDRVTPMRYGLMTLFFNVALNLTLIWVLGGVGLALGSVIASIFQSTITLVTLNRKIGSLDWSGIRNTALKGLVATGGMTAACVAVLAAMSHDSGLWRLAIPCGVGAGTYYILAKILRLQEVDDLLRRS